MGTIPFVEIDKFKNLIENQHDFEIDSLYLFGSSSYNDFVAGYSDVDLFGVLNTSDSALLIKATAILGEYARSSFSVQNVDFTLAMRSEICIESGPINPFLLKEISVSNHLIGTPITFPYTIETLREDSMRVASMGLRMLRGGLTRVSRMSRLVAVRFVDEMLFKSTKALLLAISGKLYSSRSEIIDALSSILPDVNCNTYHAILSLREQIGDGQNLSICPDELILHAVMAYHTCWVKGIQKW